MSVFSRTDAVRNHYHEINSFTWKSQVLCLAAFVILMCFAPTASWRSCCVLALPAPPLQGLFGGRGGTFNEMYNPQETLIQFFQHKAVERHCRICCWTWEGAEDACMDGEELCRTKAGIAFLFAMVLSSIVNIALKKKVLLYYHLYIASWERRGTSAIRTGYGPDQKFQWLGRNGGTWKLWECFV